VGLEQGLISPGMFTVIMLVVIGSAAIPSLFLRNNDYVPDESDMKTIVLKK